MNDRTHISDATDAGHGRRPLIADEIAYGVFASLCTLWAALVFFSSLRDQLFLSTARGAPELIPGDWSAPLDDVFIHFDFARSIVRGYPFEWSPGNGYSSGGTSLLYPFVLAIGYAIGFRETQLMLFAGIVACVCVLAVLLGARRLFRELPWWSKYTAPVCFLCVGALDWTLFSGMEVAFFLAVWMWAAVAWDDVVIGVPPETGSMPDWRRAAWLGVAQLFVVATRPEAVVCVLVFSLSAAWVAARRVDLRRGAMVLVVSALPPFLVVVAQALANKVFTGDVSAAGALVKLELHHPHLSASQVADAWWFHVKYQILRVTGYHVASNVYWGLLLWVPCVLPLFFKATRRYAVALWVTAMLWILVVALNGQVRWQNERYTMPAVAWVLLSGGLGFGLALSSSWARGARGWLGRTVSLAGPAFFMAVVAWQQFPRFRDQVWFFGRASRNIRDQHIVVARRVAKLEPTPHRVLVGDAGAIPYVSDLPALDIIGLGGFQDLPFARASRWGVAAAVELIGRMPRNERPDLMTIYPSWWGDFPLWFGEYLDGVSVHGNVICGGLTKVIYRADWRPLEHSDVPRALGSGRAVVDALDFADVVDEKEKSYRIDGAIGFVAMKLLPDPDRREVPLWDAGRVLPPGARASFNLRGFDGRAALLRFRLAPAQDTVLALTVNGSKSRTPVAAKDAWVQVDVPVAAADSRRVLDIVVEALEHEVVLYHVWGLQER